jgi:predicted ATPase
VNIKNLHIKNFKSLVDVEIIEPNPFTVFVGPNGSGKSNIFEAIEFSNYCYRFSIQEAMNLFGDLNLLNKRHWKAIKQKEEEAYEALQQNILLDAEPHEDEIGISIRTDSKALLSIITGFNFITYGSKPGYEDELKKSADYKKFVGNFSRIFIGNQKLRRLNTFDDKRLNIDASNLENVLERILKHTKTKNELQEYLELLIPGFEKIEVIATTLSNVKELLLYERGYIQPSDKNLISDGTYNILSLLTTVFQSDEPQFLCIEEPENGLHPFAIKQLVAFFRQQCQEKGHNIWLNTHSQTLVSEIRPEEIITVNKADGATVIKQHKGEDIYNLTMDEAWLSNALGGGVPW